MPGSRVAFDPIPAENSASVPAQSQGRTVVIMQKPIAVTVDVYVADFVTQTSGHQVVRDVGARVGHARTAGARSVFEIEPAGEKVGKGWIKIQPRIAQITPNVEIS